MISLNVSMISGFVSRSAVLSTAVNGKRYLVFSLGWTTPRKDEHGNWVNDLNFIDCVLFGKAANSHFKQLVKGRHVGVIGELHQAQLATSPARGFQIFVKDIDYAPRQQTTR